jgi:alpha-beta hydrolase superfamily lysophospholipase
LGVEEITFDYAGWDGTRIAAYRWGVPVRPRAIVQLAHGMGEHARRYRRSLGALVQRGFLIYANDHRGHGQTSPSASTLGDFGPGGYEIVVDDMARLTQVARTEHPDVPIFPLGHSMGSMLGQGYLIDHSDQLVGAAFSGSAAVDHLARVLEDPRGLAALNAPFQPARTDFDWLSRDAKEVDAYLADPLCGFALTPESMASLFAQGTRLADPRQLARIRKGFPLYIFAGTEDPVNANGAWLNPLIERYAAAGANVSTHLYAGARHEVLNEVNRTEVVEDLMRWLDAVLRERICPSS